MDIRVATIEDVNLISDLAADIWPSAFESILTQEQIANILERIYNPEALKHEMQDLGHVFWIANLDSQDIGYASAYANEQTIWLKKLYICPTVQGSGCGTALMEAVAEYFSGLDNISLLVHRDNTAAQEFYKHKGFSITGEEPVKMGDYEFVDLIMSRP